MNKIATYRTSIPALVLVCIYLLNPVKLLLPYLEYKTNYNYIVNFLCENKDKPQLNCNGKCYLSKALKKNQENDAKDSRVTIKNILLDELVSEEIRISQRVVISVITPQIFAEDLKSVCLEHLTPPPKYLS